jgi:hypothetical protein
MMKREHADKMLSMGLITPETHARLHQYADGGVVAQEPEYPADPRIPTPDRFNANAGQQALDVGKKALDFAKEAGSHILNRQKDLLVGPWSVSKEDVNPTNPDAIVPSQIQPADIIAPGVMGAAKAIPTLARTAMTEAPAIGRAAVDFGKMMGERVMDRTGAVGGLTVPPRMVMPGMYSKAEQLIAEKMGGSARPDQVMGILREAKPEELQHLGIQDFLAGKNTIGKKELLEHIQGNLPEIAHDVLTLEEQKGQIKAGKPQYGQYTLPGGQNYQENLYKLPLDPKLVQKEKLDELIFDISSFEANNYTMAEIANNPEGKLAQKLEYLKMMRDELQQRLADSQPKKPFKSIHFKQEPNILSHSRTNERIGPNGERHLFAEEIQSDWHQAGRKGGYQGEIPEGVTAKPFSTNFYKDQFEVVDKKNKRLGVYPAKNEQEAIQKWSQEKQAPHAPFKKTWHEFISKRLLHDAAEGGYDNVSWTTGQQQADRYSLAKKVDHLEMRPIENGTFDIIAKKDGKMIASQNVASMEEAEPLLGKEVVQKLNEQMEQGVKSPKLVGQELEIGGQGMKGFYDKMIPDFMNKIGKKYGVKVERTALPNLHESFEEWAKSKGHDLEFIMDSQGPSGLKNLKKEYNEYLKMPQMVHTMKITPEMRKAILKEGFSLFAAGGIVMGADAKAEKGKPMFTKDQADLMLQKGLITPQTHQKICGPAFLADGGVVPGMDGPQASTLPPVQSAEEQINAMTGPATTESPYKDAYQNMITKLSMQMPGADFDTIQQRALNDLSRFQEQEDARRAASMQAADQQIAMQAQRKADIGSKMASLGLGPTPAPVAAPAAPAGTPADQGGAPGAPGAPAAPAYGQEQLDYFGQMDKNYRDALAKQTGAMQGLYNAQEKTYTGLQEDLKNAHEAYEKTRASVESSYDTLSKELTNAKIDPNRVYENSSTGARIGSVLGILVSGLGAGMSGKENLAISQLNKIIDRDIDAQKTDISNKRNLLNQYREKLGDTRLAEEASRLHLMTMADFQMKQAYAKAQSPIAQAQMGMALNEWNQKMMLMKNELAKNIQEAQYRGVGGMGGRPIGSASFNAATNPKEVELTVPVYDRNREYPARSEAEAKELRKSEEGFGETMSMLNELKQLTSLGSSISPQQRARAEVITQNLPFKLNEINGYNRFTDMDEKMLSKTFSEPGVMQSIFTPNTKTNQLIEDLKKKMELKRGIGLQGYKPILSLKPRGE